MQITYYAGAADAAGISAESLETGDLTASALLAQLGKRDARFAEVLACCSLLVDGSPVRKADQLVPAQARVDILPPFAGG